MRLYLSSYGFGNHPEEFTALIGDNKRVAVIANAQDHKDIESRTERLQREIAGLKELGLEPEELDLRQYFGKPNELAKAIQKFGIFWVRGGNVFLLRRAYKLSGFDGIVAKQIRDEAVVYAGYSAGVCVLAPSLHGIELVDPTDQLGDGYDSEIIWEGLGIIDYAIAPHYKSDHPESADIDKAVAYFQEHDVPFKTLRDGEAVVVNGSKEKTVA
ncbi:MAG: Type 1 glutamine amidotransferase-like domain-containing protein [Candidatus Saccharimonadales bacterium]